MSTSFQPGDHVVDYVDDYLHGILSRGDETFIQEHAAACPICAVALSEARQRLAAMQSLATPEPSAALVNATIARVKDAAVTQMDRRTAVRRWTLRAVAGLLTAIAMLHVYLSNQAPSGYDLRLLGQRELVAGTPASLRTQLVRHDQPVRGAAVTLTLHDPAKNQAVQLASYTTDAAGTGSPRFHLPDWPDGQYTLTTVATVGLHSEILSESITLRRASRVLLSTDKPVYQPGQTIHMRALALRRPDFKPVAGQQATFQVADPAGNIILKQPTVTSGYGLASADCPLAPEITEGDYTLTCRVGEGTADKSTESQCVVEIKRYTLPKFRISLTTDKPFYAPGERVRATVQADYFFGKPVENAAIELAATATTPTAVKLATVTGRTDAQGNATLAFVLPDTLPGTPQENGNARLALAVAAKDSAGQAQSRALPLVVTAQPIHLEALPESGTLVRNLPNKVFLLATYADGRPAPVTVSVADHGAFTTNDMGVAVLELTPRTNEVSLLLSATDAAGLSSSRRIDLAAAATGDYLVRTDKAIYKAGETLTVDVLATSDAPVFVDLLKDGQTLLTTTVRLSARKGSLAIDLTPELAGTLQLRTYRFDAEGFPVRKTRLLYVQAPDDLTISASLDRSQYRPGDTARLQFRLTDKQGRPRVGALSLAAVDEAVFSVLSQAPAGLEKTFFTADQQLLQPIYTLYPSLDLARSDPGHELLAQALFFRGIPSVSSRDALLEKLVERGDLSHRSLKYLDTAWGRQALEERLQDSTLSAAQKEMLLGGDSHALEARTGPANVAQAEALQRTSREAMPLVWTAALILSGLTLLIVFHTPRIIEILCVFFLVCLLIAIMLPSLGKARELSSRSVAAAEAKGLIQVLETGNQEDPASPPLPASSARLRQFFPETLLWRPELITDASGSASLELPLADSITNWRLSSSAITAAGELGASQTSIKVFQPFFIDLALPPALTRNDEAALPVTVYNYLSAPQAVTITLDKADWFELLPDAAPAPPQWTRTVTLAPNQVSSIHFRIRALKAGTQSLHLSARTNDPNAADALQRSILILPGGQRHETVTNGTSTPALAGAAPAEFSFILPPDLIENSAYAALKLYPSTFSQVIEGLDGIFQMPYGCFEQTSSTTYPNVLALEYLQRTKKSAPAVEARASEYIHLGYQRLISFEVNHSGGFDWFGRAPANVTLTAYGLMEFTDMARVHPVDAQLIDRTRKWLLDQRQSDGSWQSAGHMHEDPASRANDATLATTAYVAWSVYSGSSSSAAAPTQSYLHNHLAAARDNPYLAALVANALLALDKSDPGARDLLTALESSCQFSPDRKLAHWSASGTAFYGHGTSASVETTALAALAMLHAGDHPATVRATLAWLISTKDAHGTWDSTQATVLALKALIAANGSPLGDQKERRFVLSSVGPGAPETLQDIRIPAGQDDVLKTIDLTPYLAPGRRTLRLTNTSDTDITYQVVFRYHTPVTAGAAVSPSLAVSINYANPTLAMGETLRATAMLRNAADKALPMILLDLPIPPGFAADTPSLDALLAAGTIDKYQLTPRQILIYLRGIDPGASLALPYTLRPTMPVKIQAPPATAYEYYNPQNRASTSPASIEVRPL